MDREARHAAVHGVTKSQTSLSDWTELNWTELKYTKVFANSQQQLFNSIYHYYFFIEKMRRLLNNFSYPSNFYIEGIYIYIIYKYKFILNKFIFLPGESQGQRSQAAYSPKDCKKSDTTEAI